jgi:hypothetical protein
LTAILKALSRQNDAVDIVKDLATQLKTRWAMETHITLGKQRLEVLNFFGKIDASSNHKACLRLRHPMTGLWVTEGQFSAIGFKPAIPNSGYQEFLVLERPLWLLP